MHEPVGQNKAIHRQSRTVGTTAGICTKGSDCLTGGNGVAIARHSDCSHCKTVRNEAIAC